MSWPFILSALYGNKGISSSLQRESVCLVANYFNASRIALIWLATLLSTT